MWQKSFLELIYRQLFAVSQTVSDYTSSLGKKGQSSEKKVLDCGQLSFTEEYIRFVVL